MPNCAGWSTPSAISASLPPKRKIRSKGDVQVIWDIPSCLLCLGETVGVSRSRPRTDELGTRSLREISPDLWLPQYCLVAPQAERNFAQPQDHLAVNE